MRKISTLLLLTLVVMQFATIGLLFNAQAYVYENRTFASGLIFNTTPDDIVSTRLLTNDGYKNNDSIQLRNVNYQILPFQLFQTFYQNVDYKYNQTSNKTTNVTSLYGYSTLPLHLTQFLLYERQLKQRITEFQTLLVLQEPDISQSGKNMHIVFDFYDTTGAIPITINFTSNMFWQLETGVDTYYSNQTNISIQTVYANYTTAINGSIWQLINTAVLFDIVFDFNSVEIQLNRVDYRYCEYQTGVTNKTLPTTATYAGNNYIYDSIVYFSEKVTFNYMDVETQLSKLAFTRTYTDTVSNVNEKVFVQCIDSSLISPYSLYITSIIPNQQVLQDSFIEDTLFFHNRCDQFYNYYYDTTDLTLLQNPLAYNVNSYTEQTNQLRYIGDYIYASNESINFYIPKSEQNISASLYPRNICLPTWKMNQSSQFVYQSNKTYFPDSQLDAFHVFYQTNATQDHILTFNVFSQSVLVTFSYSTEKITVSGNDIPLAFQNIFFRSFDIYFYPRRQSDGTFKLSFYVEYFGQKSYAHTSIDIDLYGRKHNNTMLVGFSYSTVLWFATCENVNLYRAYNSMSTDIYHATKQYRYKCLYETIIEKERDFAPQLYADAPLMSQLSNLNGYYFTKLGVFSESYETQHMTALRAESQISIDFENTTLDMSRTSNESYEYSSSIIGASSLNNGQQKLVELHTTQSETTNLTPSVSNIDALCQPRQAFGIGILVGILIIASIVTPIIVKEVRYHDEPINTTNTLMHETGIREGVRDTIDTFENVSQNLQDGWNNIVNVTTGFWNNLTEGASDIFKPADNSQHFNVVVITASTILQYENTDATFDMLTYIINLAIPIVILILFVFLMKKFHTKLAILGFFIGIVMLYIMDYISLKFAVVLALLFIVFAWVYLYSQKESDIS